MKTALLFTTLCLLLTAPIARAQAPASDLVAYHSFNRNANDVVSMHNGLLFQAVVCTTPPLAVLSGIEPVNFPPEGIVTMQVSLTGTAPWSFTLTDGSSYVATQSPFLIQKTGVTTTRSYRVAAFRDAVCPAGVASGEVYVSAPVCLSNAVELGAAETIQAPGIANLETAFTMEAWVQPKSVAGEEIIMGFESCGVPAPRGFLFGLSGGLIQLFGYNGQPFAQLGRFATQVRIDPMIWTHLAVSYNRADGRTIIHKNGVLVFDELIENTGYGGTRFNLDNTNGLSIGSPACNYRARTTLVDEVRVWNFARTTAEIRQYMGGPITGSEANLMLYYDMNRSGTGAGLTVQNLATTTGAANDGTTTGGLDGASFVAICPAPDQPGSITATQTNVCREAQAIYSVPEVSGLVYVWRYTGSDVVVKAYGGQAVLSFGPAATSGVLSVVAGNPAGGSVGQTLALTVGACSGTCNPVAVLNGSSTIPVGNLGDFSGDGTISFWMKPNSFTGGSTILAAGNEFQVLFSAVNGSLGLYHNDGGLQYYNYSDLPFSPTWQHVVITWDINAYYYEARRLKTYVDGKYLGPLQIFGSYALFNNLILGGNLAGHPTFDGLLDDVAIWTKQFTPEEVATLRNATLTGAEPGLKYYYSLNHSGSGSGITVTNSAGITAGQFNGTTVGNVVFSNRSSLRAGLVASGTLTCGQNVTLTATGGTSYSFSGSGIMSQNASAGTAVVNAPGMYSVTVINTSTGCFSTTSLTVSQNSSGSLSISLTANNILSCSNPTPLLTATPGAANYQFSGPGLSQSGPTNTATASTTGVFSVTATTGVCSSSATVTLTGGAGTPPNALLFGNGSLSCQTPTLSLTAVGGSHYQFSGPGGLSAGILSQTNGQETTQVNGYLIVRTPIPTLGTAIVNQPGIYTVLVTDANGCSATATIVVTGTACPNGQ